MTSSSSPEDSGSVSGAPNLTAMSTDKITLREGYAEIGDVTLHYVEAGEGPLIVLLHGFPEFLYGWRLQIEPLAAAGFRGRRTRHARLQPFIAAGRRRRLRHAV